MTLTNNTVDLNIATRDQSGLKEKKNTREKIKELVEREKQRNKRM